MLLLKRPASPFLELLYSHDVRGNSKEFGFFSYAFLEGALEMGAPPQLSKNSQEV
jgi:hypothetical protein